jgi:DNA-binding NarL/FixJ family response regulator
VSVVHDGGHHATGPEGRNEQRTMSNDIIGVLLVDDHQLFTDALAHMLEAEPDLEVVAMANTAADAVQRVVRMRPDVVVVDPALADAAGLEVVRALRRAAPDTRVVLLTARGDRATFAAAMTAGCVGFIGKQEPAEVLLDAIRAVVAGDMAIPRSMVASLVPSTGRRSDELSARETEVLVLLADGVSTERIGETLFLSRNTVRAHVQRVITKLGTHSKLEAVAEARRRALI